MKINWTRTANKETATGTTRQKEQWRMKNEKCGWMQNLLLNELNRPFLMILTRIHTPTPHSAIFIMTWRISTESLLFIQLAQRERKVSNEKVPFSWCQWSFVVEKKTKEENSFYCHWCFESRGTNCCLAAVALLTITKCHLKQFWRWTRENYTNKMESKLSSPTATAAMKSGRTKK